MHLQHRHRLHKNNFDDALHLGLFFSLAPESRVSIETGDTVLCVAPRGCTGVNSLDCCLDNSFTPLRVCLLLCCQWEV